MLLIVGSRCLAVDGDVCYLLIVVVCCPLLLLIVCCLLFVSDGCLLLLLLLSDVRFVLFALCSTWLCAGCRC